MKNFFQDLKENGAKRYQMGTKERTPWFIVKREHDRSQRWHCLSSGVDIFGVWIGNSHLHLGVRFNFGGVTGQKTK